MTRKRLGGASLTNPVFRAIVVGVSLFGIVTLGGCETLYPTFEEISVDHNLATPALQSGTLLKNSAVQLRTKYATGFNESSKIADFSTLPLVAAAAASAGLLLFDAGTNLLKGVALGAGTYSVGRLLFVPKGVPELYANARSAVNCVITKGQPLTRDASQLDGETQVLRNEISAAHATLAINDPAKITSGEQKLLDDARRNLRAEIANANEAVKKAGAAMGAYIAGPQTIESALQDIQTRVAKKIREGRSISFKDAVAAITKTYQSKPLSAAKISAAKRSATELSAAKPPALLQELIGKTLKLAGLRQKLEAGIPPYAEAQEKVGLCPERI